MKKLFLFILFFTCFVQCFSQLCTGNSGNLKLNVTFGSGASNPGGTFSTVTGGTTSYTYAPVTGTPPGLIYDGEYSIINQVPGHAPWFAGASDHTGNSNGYMAFFNAATTTGEFYKQTISGLSQNTVYEFGAWFGNVLRQGFFATPSFPNVTFEIRNAGNNALLATYNTGNIPMSTTGSLVWNKYGALFTTPSGVTSVILILLNNNVGGTNNPGNDFALDDITLKECLCNTVTANAGGDRSICVNDTIQLLATGGTKYSWAPSANLSSDTIANPLAFPSITTDYIVTVSNGTCSSKDTVRVTLGTCNGCPFGAKTLSQELITNGDFENGNSGFTSGYTFKPVNLNNQGEYTITNDASLNNIKLSNCKDHTDGRGNFFLAEGGNSSTTKVWSQTIPVKQNTTYLISFWGLNTYTNTQALLQIVVNGTATSSVYTIPTTSCLWKNYGFNWNSGSSNSATLDFYDLSTVFIGTDFGVDDISFRECGCFPVSSSISDQFLCFGDSIQINATNTNAQKYKWLPVTGVSNDTIPNPWLKPSTTTTYTVKLSNGNCEFIDTFTITINQNSITNLGNDSILCNGSTLKLFAPNGTTNLWNTGDTAKSITITAIADTINFLPQKYWVKSGVGACVSSDTILIYSLVKPRISTLLNSKTTICAGTALVLKVSNVPPWSKIKWSNGDTSKSISVTPLNTTTYSVTYFSNECNYTDSIKITVDPIPLLSMSSSATNICAGTPIKLSVRGATSYLWSNTATDSDIIVSPLSTTNYWVIGSNGNCISDTQKILITVLPKAKSQFIATPTIGSIPLSVQFVNQSAFAIGYLWDFGDGDTSSVVSPQHIFKLKGQYTVRLIAFHNNGCNDTSSALIIATNPFYLFVPNAFSPDGNGLNDSFEISFDGIKYMDGFIFDRWGELIYKWHVPGELSWNGTFKEKPCPQGAYIYVLNIKDSNNYGHNYKGWVYLIR